MSSSGYVDELRQPRIKLLTESADALIGSGLLASQKLTIGYANHFVVIEPDIILNSHKRKKRKSKK